jgi:hypothetical protein
MRSLWGMFFLKEMLGMINISIYEPEEHVSLGNTNVTDKALLFTRTHYIVTLKVSNPTLPLPRILPRITIIVTNFM